MASIKVTAESIGNPYCQLQAVENGFYLTYSADLVFFKETLKNFVDLKWQRLGGPEEDEIREPASE
jgi:hypothetical protein